MALWHLVSHLSLNHLSLVEDGRDALQQILRLYDFTDSPFTQKMIEGITDLKSRPHFAPIVTENGVSFARGTRVELEIDEEQFVGGGVYLFASVIEHFLALYATLNSFTQLSARTRQRKEVIREWPRERDRKSWSDDAGRLPGRSAARHGGISRPLRILPGGAPVAADVQPA